MNNLDDFLAMVRDELGLAVTIEDAGLDLDQIPGWDSIQLLWLLKSIESRTGKAVSFADMIEATSLGEIYAIAQESAEKGNESQ